MIALTLALHLHGVTVPDWYDAQCCNAHDCAPAEDPQPQPDRIGNAPVYRYDGLTFTRPMFKGSQDERFHVCIDPGTGGTAHPRKALCIYIPRFARLNDSHH